MSTAGATPLPAGDFPCCKSRVAHDEPSVNVGLSRNPTTKDTPMDDQPAPARCEHEVWWWELDCKERCHRPAGHRGFHYDGLWHWDSDGHRVPRDLDDDE